MTDTTDTPTGTPNPADVAPKDETQQPAQADPPKDDGTDWKTEARKWEQRAKDNKSAADELAALKDSQKTESERLAEALAEAKTEAEQVPGKVSAALRSHLVKIHEISDEDAELFLTSTDPEVLLKQAERFVAHNKSASGYVPTQGTANPSGAQVSAFELGRERAKARYQNN